MRKKPMTRRLIQLYSALLYNAHLKGFAEGRIYTGPLKSLCVPGLNCYSCPGAVAACPLGALQNAVAASADRPAFYVVGTLLLFSLLLGRVVCGFLCPFGLLQELLHKLPTKKLQKSPLTRMLSRLKYALLLIFVLGIPAWFAFRRLPLPGFCKFICPAGTLEGAVLLLLHPANGALRAMTGGLFWWKCGLMLLILTGSVFVFRCFCRFLCPLGALYGLMARLALLGVKLGPLVTGLGAATAVLMLIFQDTILSLVASVQRLSSPLPHGHPPGRRQRMRPLRRLHGGLPGAGHLLPGGQDRAAGTGDA